jgi:hypothetical protein
MTQLSKRVYWLVCLALLSCAFANASPILDCDNNVDSQFTKSLPLQNWIGPDLWLKQLPFDLEDLASACPLPSPGVLECLFKFFINNDPAIGELFGNDPFLPAPQGTDPVTPEPPAWTLLAIGLIGVAVFRHIRVRTSASS